MHASRADLPAQVMGEYEGRFVDWEGTRIAFEAMPAHFPPDESPFKGLPDDRCQCPHWGVLTRGSMVVDYGDHSETVQTGDVFYMPPGHRPTYEVGTQIIQFSPTADLKATDEAIRRNLAALQGA